MKTFKHALDHLCGAAFFAMLLLPLVAFSQKTTKIDLVNANSLEVTSSIEGGAKRLLGNVALKHDDTYLYCDSAYLYSDSNSVKAFGSVRIRSSSVTINGRFLNYDGNSKTADIFDDVKMTDGQMTLTTDHLTYNTRSNIGSYATGGKMTDAETRLTSRIGYYYADDKQFFFKNQVLLVKPQYTMNSDTLMYNTGTEVSYFFGPTTIVSKENTIYCENGWYDTKRDIAQFSKNAVFTNPEQKLSGDSLYYDKKAGLGKAFNNITVVDSLQKVLLKGDYAEYFEREGKTMITRRAQLIQDISGDSLFLHADTLKAFFDTTARRRGKTLFAYNHAKFYKSDLQGMGDSLIYSFADSLITMYDAPVLWTDKNQLTADTIAISMGRNSIRQLFLYSSSFIVIKDDSARFNQVKGRNLVGHFADNKLRLINVNGNCETVYYVWDDDSAMVGVNKAVADSLLIMVEENKIQTITFISNPEATLFPEKDLAPADVKLKDFKWEEGKRPASRWGIFF